MGKIHRITTPNGDMYFNTKTEADSYCREMSVEPQRSVSLDSAAVCNRLEGYLNETEGHLDRLRHMMQELLMACPPSTVAGTEIGRQVQKYCIDNPVSRPRQ